MVNIDPKTGEHYSVSEMDKVVEEQTREMEGR